MGSGVGVIGNGIAGGTSSVVGAVGVGGDDAESTRIGVEWGEFGISAVVAVLTGARGSARCWLLMVLAISGWRPVGGTDEGRGPGWSMPAVVAW